MTSKWIRAGMGVALMLALAPALGPGDATLDAAGRCWAAPTTQGTAGDGEAIFRPSSHGTYDGGSMDCNGSFRNC